MRQLPFVCERESEKQVFSVGQNEVESNFAKLYYSGVVIINQAFTETFYRIVPKYASVYLTTFRPETREIRGDQIRSDRGPHVPRGRLPSEQFVARKLTDFGDVHESSQLKEAHVQRSSIVVVAQLNRSYQCDDESFLAVSLLLTLFFNCQFPPLKSFSLLSLINSIL